MSSRSISRACALFGLEYGSCTERDVKSAYKTKSLLLHPDRNFGKDTTAQFQVINAAYEFLMQHISEPYVAPPPTYRPSNGTSKSYVPRKQRNQKRTGDDKPVDASDDETDSDEDPTTGRFWSSKKDNKDDKNDSEDSDDDEPRCHYSSQTSGNGKFFREAPFTHGASKKQETKDAWTAFKAKERRDAAANRAREWVAEEDWAYGGARSKKGKPWGRAKGKK